jgi:hypothetical protein
MPLPWALSHSPFGCFIAGFAKIPNLKVVIKVTEKVCAGFALWSTGLRVFQSLQEKVSHFGDIPVPMLEDSRYNVCLTTSSGIENGGCEDGQNLSEEKSAAKLTAQDILHVISYHLSFHLLAIITPHGHRNYDMPRTTWWSNKMRGKTILWS